jgi:hypothetical protein
MQNWLAPTAIRLLLHRLDQVIGFWLMLVHNERRLAA